MSRRGARSREFAAMRQRRLLGPDHDVVRAAFETCRVHLHVPNGLSSFCQPDEHLENGTADSLIDLLPDCFRKSDTFNDDAKLGTRAVTLYIGCGHGRLPNDL
jgi:hypothetical protein